MGRVMPIPPSKGRVMGCVMGYCGGVANAPGRGLGWRYAALAGAYSRTHVTHAPRIHTPNHTQAKRKPPIQATLEPTHMGARATIPLRALHVMHAPARSAVKSRPEGPKYITNHRVQGRCRKTTSSAKPAP